MPGSYLLVGGLDVEELDERLDGDALHEHGPVHHGDGRRHEHGRVRHVLKQIQVGSGKVHRCRGSIHMAKISARESSQESA